MRQIYFYAIYAIITTLELLLWQVTGNAIGLFGAGFIAGIATIVTVIIIADRKGWA